MIGNSATARGEQVLAALQVLDTEGIGGFTAASRANPAFAEHLRKKVLAILAQAPEIREVPSAPESSQESGRQSSGAASEPERILMAKHGETNRIVGAAGTERKSTTKKLADEYGGKAVTNMTHLVILQHLLTQPREASVRTILKELVEAHLIDPKQRGSLVTSLNRLKKKKEFITWPNGKRGEEITLTTNGQNYLKELKERKLLASELDYLKKNASASISENLP